MLPFEYVRATDPFQAVATVTADPRADYLAGGTTELDLMLRDGVIAPERLVDITRLPLKGITAGERAVRIGATTTMEELAADPIVAERLPVVREALLAGASVQLRNMATIGGNLLQRTRCRYFRDATVPACNKRRPGSGCAAVAGPARMHAILGSSEHCIALHASDLAVALVVLDTRVHCQVMTTARSIPLTDLYREPGDTPDVETVMEHGELITDVEIPWLPDGARSTYLKVRDRASYEFALASAAVVVTLRDGAIREARVGLGGVGTVPWRARAAEEVLRGAQASTESFLAAAEAEVRDPFTVPGTEFKVELAKRTMVRALQTVTGAAR